MFARRFFALFFVIFVLQPSASPTEVVAQTADAWSTRFGAVGANDDILVLAVHEGLLIAGGSFVDVGGVPAHHIAAWDGSHWTALGSGLPSMVTALFSDGVRLYAGMTGGVWSWDGTVWSQIADETVVLGAVVQIGSYAGSLLVGVVSGIHGSLLREQGTG